ncbi:hypothetical protein C8F01DRAFT_1250885 [Mycena amicta]|nr:hypothetical protein C8F01DRAFT_1250885 [Mycena amicta]
MPPAGNRRCSLFSLFQLLPFTPVKTNCDLPLTTFDVFPNGHGSEAENLVPNSPRSSDCTSTVTSENTIKAVECASLLSLGPAASPLLLTPPAIQLQSPNSPKLCPSFSADPQKSPTGLGKRRGFKGAPLFTPDTAKRQTSSFLSSATKSPRTPLSAVTNLIRTPTMKSPIKSPKLQPAPPELPISDALQRIYSAEDPFSVTAESCFYSPDVCGAVPFSVLFQVDVYAMDSTCETTKPKLWATHVYDAMVRKDYVSAVSKASSTLSRGCNEGRGGVEELKLAVG